MRKLTTAPRAVWLITGLHAALLVLYSVSFAPFRGPDEPQHTDLVRYVRSEKAYPRYDERHLGRPIFSALPIVRFDVPAVASRDLPVEGAPARADRPTFDELGSDLETVPEEMNQLPSHPPLYYALAATATELADALPGDLAFDQEVGFLRLLDALMLLPLPLLAWATARRIGASWSAGLAAACFPLCIPQLHHIGASVTNDVLLILLVSVATLLVARIATGDRTWRTALVLGLVAGLALFTKAFALFIPLWIVLAFAVAVRRGWNWRVAGPRAGGALVVAFAFGGWWWARNLIVFGQLQTGIKLFDSAPPGFEADVLWWVGRYITFMPWRFWGWFGWFDVAIPAWLALLATIGVITLVLLAVIRRGDKARRVNLGLVLMPTVAIAGMVAIGAFQGYLRTGFDEGLQGRYLFPGLVGLSVAVAIGFGRRRWSPLVIVGAAALMQLSGWLTILSFYWGGDGVAAEIRSLAAWSAWPPVVLVALFVVLVLLAGGTVAELVREARRERSTLTVAPAG